MLWLVLFALLLGLAVQAAISQRDWLAAREPRLTPLLQGLCKPLDCTVSPYRLLDAIVSDDPTALVGLPLIRTCRMLRAAGLTLP